MSFLRNLLGSSNEPLFENGTDEPTQYATRSDECYQSPCTPGRCQTTSGDWRPVPTERINSEHNQTRRFTRQRIGIKQKRTERKQMGMIPVEHEQVEWNGNRGVYSLSRRGSNRIKKTIQRQTGFRPNNIQPVGSNLADMFFKVTFSEPVAKHINVSNGEWQSENTLHLYRR